MNDYRVKIKVRNNRILKAMEEIGAVPGNKWCDKNNISYVCFNDLINMTAGPLYSDGSLTATALKLCEALNKIPEDLWSNEQLRPLERNFTELEMSNEQVVSLLQNKSEITYLQDFDEFEMKSFISESMKTLDSREQKVLHYRFFEDYSLEDVAKVMDVTRERIRQIEAKALRKLRHPTISKDLRAFLLGYYPETKEEEEENSEPQEYIVNSGYYRV